MSVTKCRMIVRDRNGAAIHDVDLLLEDGRPPRAVFEWSDYPDGTSIPAVAVQLDPSQLFDLPGWGDVTHGYQTEVESPITLPRNI